MILETERLHIRPWKETDVELYLRLSRDMGYNCFTVHGQFAVRDEAHAREKVRQRMALFETRGLGKFLVFERESGDFAGTCGIDPYPLDGREEWELGYRLCLAHWGKGYATEAARCLLDYGFRRLRLPEIIAFAVPQNRGSLNVIEKLGFRYRRDFTHNGLPHRLYGLPK